MLNTIGIGKNSCSIKEAEKNYSKIGLSRTRKYLIARHNNEIVGFSFADISSYGISLSLLFNAFYIFILDTEKKEEIYNAALNKINSILTEHGKVYSIGIVKPDDRIYLEKHGYQCSRNYSAFIGSGDNDQFLKSYNYINTGRR